MLYARQHESGAMNSFVLHLQSATQYERIENVESFVGQDSSGSFGILAGHARSMTSLVFGLARFRTGDQVWRYLALPGALLYLIDNQLYINTRRYHYDSDYKRISSVLRDEMLAEEEKLQGVKESLQQLEQAMLKRMWSMQADGRRLT